MSKRRTAIDTCMGCLFTIWSDEEMVRLKIGSYHKPCEPQLPERGHSEVKARKKKKP